MKKLFPLFIVVLLLAGSWSVWYYYNQPIEAGPVVQNGSNQNEVVAATAPSFVQARGTEPFWGLLYSGSELVWSAPGNIGVDTTIFTGVVSMISGTSYLYTDITNHVMLTITPGVCTDGMSENIYSGFALVQFSTGPNLPLYNGCANW